MHVLAQAPLRADPEAVADQQHPDHQRRINRGPSHLAVERSQMRADIREIDEAINGAHPVP